MDTLSQFRRYLLLLLGLTLSVQAMAVASLGSCHKAKEFAHVNVYSLHGHHGDTAAHSSATHRHGDQQAAATQSADLGDRSTQDGSIATCAACAACHLCSVALATQIELADTPADGSARFPKSTVARARNVASGLERPPRA